MELFDFAYCGNYSATLANLAMLAPEKWSFGGKNDNSILKSYVEHTFSRLYAEGKVVENSDYAIFSRNTTDVSCIN